MKSERTQKTYRIYIAQVNQTYVDVTARSASEAAAKGYARWRREDAHSRVIGVERRAAGEGE